MHNHWLFLGNVFAHLVASMSGVVSFCIAIWEALKNKKIESRVFFVIAALFLLVACDQAWQDEHNSIKVLIGEKGALWSERDFWKGQSYDKDAALHSRDALLAQNYTALIGEQTTAIKSQQSLSQLSNKILDINKPQAQKFTVRRDDTQSSIFTKWKYHTQFVVMTNLPVDGRFVVACDAPIGEMDARIMEGGPTFPGSVQKAQSNVWLVRIPSPQVTPDKPMLITIGYDQDAMGACQTGPYNPWIVEGTKFRNECYFSLHKRNFASPQDEFGCVIEF